jgi:hypothetical protein
MNKNLEKTNSLLHKLVRFFNEQFWLILLLAPLLIIAALVGPNFQANKEQTHNARSSSTKQSVSIEISSAELALIVAKPLSELLAMEVYSDHKQKVRNKSRLLTLDLAGGFSNEAYNQLLINHIATRASIKASDKDNVGG